MDGPTDGAALRDAAAIAERVSADEARAAAARDSYRTGGLPSVALPDAVAPYLDGDELAVASRRVLVERTSDPDGSDDDMGRAELYVTTRRLLFVGASKVDSIPLDAVGEIGVVGDRVMQITTAGGGGIALDTHEPRLLRVQIQAARELRTARAVPQRDSR